MKKIVLSYIAAATCFVLANETPTHKTETTSKEAKIIAITILAEARGEGEAGMYAVGAVIAQRAFEGKRTPSEVCLKKWQFSCWNGKKPKDLAHLLKTPQAKYALLIAKNINNLSREFKGKKPVKTIGNHIFYKL